MSEANAAFADFEGFFGLDDAWASLPPSPVMSMGESDDSYDLSIALEDRNTNHFNVQLDGRLLTITSHQDTRTPHASSAQHFSSRLLLPGPVEPDAILQITNETGRLLIRIPKPNTAPTSTPAPTATASR